MAKNKTSRNKKNDILNYLSREEQKEFINDLLNAASAAIKKNDVTVIDDCISSWEATVELNGIPGFKRHVIKRINEMKKAGIINE